MLWISALDMYLVLRSVTLERLASDTCHHSNAQSSSKHLSWTFAWCPSLPLQSSYHLKAAHLTWIWLGFTGSLDRACNGAMHPNGSSKDLQTSKSAFSECCCLLAYLPAGHATPFWHHQGHSPPPGITRALTPSWHHQGHHSLPSGITRATVHSLLASPGPFTPFWHQ